MAKPLEGVRVLELGQLMAGPFAGTILAYYGAKVIKIEPPGGGDPVHTWRGIDEDGTSLWWRSLARNKKCITADLRTDAGRALARELAWKSEVIIENFKPGTVEKWGPGPEDIKPQNPDVIYCRVSGYGQTAPYSHKPGYAAVCEGVGGFRYVNGFPDRPPCRPNLSLGDSLAGLHAALGIVMAPGAQGAEEANMRRRTREARRAGAVDEAAKRACPATQRSGMHRRSHVTRICEAGH